jgi:hypothetical protein
MATLVRLTTVEDLSGTTTVAQGKPIQPEGNLAPTHWCVTGPDGDQGIYRWIIQEDVDLIRVERLGHQVTGLVEGAPDLRRLDRQQTFERGQELFMPGRAASF